MWLDEKGYYAEPPFDAQWPLWRHDGPLTFEWSAWRQVHWDVRYGYVVLPQPPRAVTVSIDERRGVVTP